MCFIVFKKVKFVNFFSDLWKTTKRKKSHEITLLTLLELLKKETQKLKLGSVDPVSL